MFTVKVTFMDYISDGSPNGTVKPQLTHGVFNSLFDHRVDELVRVLAARPNVVSVEVDNKTE